MHESVGELTDSNRKRLVGELVERDSDEDPEESDELVDGALRFDGERLAILRRKFFFLNQQPDYTVFPSQETQKPKA